MLKNLKKQIPSLSLSGEYFLFSLVIFITITMVSIFLYSYNYSLYTSIETTHLQKQAGALKNKFSNFFEKNPKFIQELGIEIAKEHDLHFMIADNDCHILFAPTTQNASKGSKIPDCEAGALSYLKHDQGFLGKPFLMNAVHYSYYTKLKNQPYLIYMGYDQALLEKNLHNNVLPKLYSFLLGGILCMIILYFFRRKIITPISKLSEAAILISKGDTNIHISKQNSIEMFHLAKALLLVKRYINRNALYRKKLEAANQIIESSVKAREDFIYSINKEVIHPLREIMIYSEILLKEIIQKSHSKELIEQAVTCIEKIKEATTNIKSKTSGSLNLSFFDMKEMMEEVIQINLKQSLRKNIHIHYHAPKNMPPLYGDSLKLKQIFVALLSQSIQNSPENLTVSITMTEEYMHHQSQSFVKIKLQDQSFGLSEEELDKIQEKIGWHDENHLFSKIDFAFIQKLVEMHQGTFHYENKLHQGRTILFTFPLLTEDNLASHQNKNNLYYLSKN